MEDVTLSGEEAISFLHKAHKTLESKYPSVGSYFNIHCLHLALRLNVNLPAGWNKKNLVCLHCLTPWSSDKYVVKLRPAVKPNKKLRLALRKQEENRKCSRVEKNLVASLHFGNRIILNCLVCHKTTSFLIDKRWKQDVAEPDRKKIKKKRKRDPLSGLSPAVLDQVKKVKTHRKTSKADVVPLESSECICNKEDNDEGGAILDRFGYFNCKLHDRIYGKKGKITQFEVLHVTPLGTKPATAVQSSRAPSFIPVGSGVKKQTKPAKFLNPFALKEAEGCKKKEKKLNRLQKMIAEEETKPKKKNSSLKDFLTLV